MVCVLWRRKRHKILAGDNLDLNGACFHGHWRLRKFLLGRGADANRPLPNTGESPLHAALCTTNRLRHDLVLRVLLAQGANPNCATKPSVETGVFMLGCRSKGETRCIVRLPSGGNHPDVHAGAAKRCQGYK